MPDSRSIESYLERLLRELGQIEADYVAVLEGSTIRDVNPNGPNIPFVIRPQAGRTN